MAYLAYTWIILWLYNPHFNWQRHNLIQNFYRNFLVKCHVWISDACPNAWCKTVIVTHKNRNINKNSFFWMCKNPFLNWNPIIKSSYVELDKIVSKPVNFVIFNIKSQFCNYQLKSIFQYNVFCKKTYE